MIMGQNSGDHQRPVPEGKEEIMGGGVESGKGGSGQHLWYTGKREGQTTDAPRKGGGGQKVKFSSLCFNSGAPRAENYRNLINSRSRPEYLPTVYIMF